MDRTDSVMDLYCLLHVCVLSTCRPTTKALNLYMSPFPVQLKFDVRLASETPLVASEDCTLGMDDLGYTHTDTRTHTRTHIHIRTHAHTHTQRHKHTKHVHMSLIMAVSYRHTLTHIYTHANTHTHKHTQHVHMSQIMAISYMASETPLAASEDRSSGMDDLGYTRTRTHTHTHTHTHI